MTSARGEQSKAALDGAIKKKLEIERHAAKYVAKKAPNHTKKVIPVHSVSTQKPATEPNPFHLRSSYRHELAKSSLQQEVENSVNRMKNETIFHAVKLPDTTYRPGFLVFYEECSITSD